MAKATVLVVEDDPDIRELLAFALGKEGWTMVAAADAEDGLARLAVANPDVIVLDIMLPGMDGLDFLRKVKSDPALRRLPVIMTTAKGEDSDIVAGLELGAEDYVVKPYSPKVLAARIRAALTTDGRPGRPPFRTETPVVKGGSASTRRGTRSASTSVRSISRRPSSPFWSFSSATPAGSFRAARSSTRSRAATTPSPTAPSTCRYFRSGASWARAMIIETVRGVGYRLKD